MAGLEILIFLVLLIAIAGGGWLLSNGAETVAEKYGANFAGSIVLALVTTLPEYLFVFFAVLKNKPEVALGSAIGACTLLVTLGYGSVILLATSRFSKHPVKHVHLSENTRIDGIYLIIIALLALVLSILGGGLNWIDGTILAAVFVSYVYHHYKVARYTARTGEHSVTREDVIRAGWMFLGGAAIILACADPFVDSMIRLAELLNVNPMVVALILSPIASEMPEKMTAYLTVMRDGSLAEISVANFIGSEVNHNSLLLAVMAITAAACGRGAISEVISPAFITMTTLTVFAGINLLRRKLTRNAGWAFLALYGIAMLVWVVTGSAPAAH